jgi:hypothetical protein
MPSSRAAGRGPGSRSAPATCREQALSRDVADGYIVLKDKADVRLVADGPGFTNETKNVRRPWVDEVGKWNFLQNPRNGEMITFAVQPWVPAGDGHAATEVLSRQAFSSDQTRTAAGCGCRSATAGSTAASLLLSEGSQRAAR